MPLDPRRELDGDFLLPFIGPPAHHPEDFIEQRRHVDVGEPGDESPLLAAADIQQIEYHPLHRIGRFVNVARGLARVF